MPDPISPALLLLPLIVGLTVLTLPAIVGLTLGSVVAHRRLGHRAVGPLMSCVLLAAVGIALTLALRFVGVFAPIE